MKRRRQFVAVAEESSFIRAADRLSVVQSAESASIGGLVRELLAPFETLGTGRVYEGELIALDDHDGRHVQDFGGGRLRAAATAPGPLAANLAERVVDGSSPHRAKSQALRAAAGHLMRRARRRS